MVASIGVVASPSQGAGYYERDGYYAKDDPEHHAASAWAGRGAADLSLEGLYASKMLLGALYRNELVGELKGLGYEVEKRVTGLEQGKT